MSAFTNLEAAEISIKAKLEHLATMQGFAGEFGSDILSRGPDYLLSQKQRDLIERLFAENWLIGHSKFLPGACGGKVRDLYVKVLTVRLFDGAYGPRYLYKFVTQLGDCVATWTGRHLGLEVGQLVTIDGTIKKFDDYKGQKTTLLTRIKVK